MLEELEILAAVGCCGERSGRGGEYTRDVRVQSTAKGETRRYVGDCNCEAELRGLLSMAEGI